MPYKKNNAIKIAIFENNQHYSPDAINYAEIWQAFNETGILLLRNWAFDELSFQQLTRKFCNQFHAIGIRHHLRAMQGDGYSTQVFSDNCFLLGHTEGSYKPSCAFPENINYPPEVCFFMCLIAPIAEGGETTLIDGGQFMQRLAAPLRKRFQNEGIIYGMIWNAERWKNEFHVQNTESLLQLLAVTPNIKYHLQDDILELFCHIPAITRTLKGDEVFATALLAHLPRITHSFYRNKNVYIKESNSVLFGNGDPIPDDMINSLIDIHDNLLYKHRWQQHDVLFVDNTRYLHGRTMMTYPCERILLSRFGWLYNYKNDIVA